MSEPRAFTIPSYGEAGRRIDTNQNNDIDLKELSQASSKEGAQAVADAVEQTQSEEVVINSLEMILKLGRSKGAEIGVALFNNTKRFSKTSPAQLKLMEGTGFLLYRLGRKEEAKVALEEAMHRGTKFSEVYYLYGVLLIEKGDYQGALQNLSKAASLNPRDQKAADSLLNIGNKIVEDTINSYKMGEIDGAEIFQALLLSRSFLDAAKKASKSTLQYFPDNPKAKKRIKEIDDAQGMIVAKIKSREI